MQAHLSLSSSVVLAPRRAGLRAGSDNLIEVLVRIQAADAPTGPGGPDGPATERAPQALALVIDHSGSMAGQPLAEAQRCAEHVLGRLRPGDAVSLVQFDHRVQRLWPAVPLGDGKALRAAIAGIRSGGHTQLHGGWLEGARTLVEVAGHGLKRVILLSDGQANEGLTDGAAIAAQCAQWAARGISTSTYGLGRDFNEELMVAMARAGGGNAYYGERAEDLMEPFEQELELLANLCLRDLRLVATVPAAHTAAAGTPGTTAGNGVPGVTVQMINALPALPAPPGTQGAWRLPDLAWGAEAWALLRITLPAAALPAAGHLCTVLRVAVEGLGMEGETVPLERAGLSLPVLAPATHASLVEDELVARRLTELAAADALEGMRRAATADDWARVDTLLEEASRRFAGNEWVAAMLEAMRAIAASREREHAMKEMLYSSSKLRSRLAAKDELAYSVCEQSEVPAFLRRKPAQGKGEAG